MKFIRHIKRYQALKPNGKHIVYMHGYGGYIWMASRQIHALQKRGYSVLAMDFRDILHRKNPQDLLTLMDEIAYVFESEKLINSETVIVGISLGGLAGLNMLRRYPELKKLFVITGGDISRLPFERGLKNKWKITRSELANQWTSVNMYTTLGTSLQGKHITMLLPKRDKLIDPQEVINEIMKHKHLNNIKLFRTDGGHFRTIISETIIRPTKSLDLVIDLDTYND